MTSGLAWLNELMMWLGKWFPRIVLVKAAHQAVKFGRAGRAVLLQPGLYVYWPITTEVKVVSVRPRTTEIAAQLLGREVVSVCVKFCIIDPLKALLSLNDLFSMIDDRTQAALTKSHASDRASDEIASMMLSALQSEFAPSGLDIQSVDVIQRGRVIPLKNMNDWAQHSTAELA